MCHNAFMCIIIMSPANPFHPFMYPCVTPLFLSFSQIECFQNMSITSSPFILPPPDPRSSLHPLSSFYHLILPRALIRCERVALSPLQTRAPLRCSPVSLCGWPSGWTTPTSTASASSCQTRAVGCSSMTPHACSSLLTEGKPSRAFTWANSGFVLYMRISFWGIYSNIYNLSVTIKCISLKGIYKSPTATSDYLTRSISHSDGNVLGFRLPLQQAPSDPVPVLCLVIRLASSVQNHGQKSKSSTHSFTLTRTSHVPGRSSTTTWATACTLWGLTLSRRSTTRNPHCLCTLLSTWTSTSSTAGICSRHRERGQRWRYRHLQACSWRSGSAPARPSSCTSATEHFR